MHQSKTKNFRLTSPQVIASTLLLLAGFLFLGASPLYAEDMHREESSLLSSNHLSITSELIHRLYTAQTGTLDEESLQYLLKDSWIIPVKDGSMQWTVTLTNYCGRQAYGIHQITEFDDRRQEDRSLVDRSGLFPYEYTRKVHRTDGTIRMYGIKWDHLGKLLFHESNDMKGDEIIRATARDEWQLGKGMPSSVIDSLTALFLYRLKCTQGGKSMPWTVPVVDGGDEVFISTFSPIDQIEVLTTEPPGTNSISVVDWVIKRKGAIMNYKKVRLALATESNFIPVSYTASLWGFRGTMNLTTNKMK
jgi:hypothetical protein